MTSAEKEQLDSMLYDLGRLAETSALQDHEIQRLVVLIRSAPDDEARWLIFKACGPNLPDFLEMAEQLRQTGIAFLRLNEAIDRIIREGINPEAQNQVEHRAEPQDTSLTPAQVDPVFAEGLRQLRDAQNQEPTE